jgi:heme-degrading monooxygenase HmoA
MVIRIWATKVVPSRLAEYELFAHEYSLPMFRQQPGFRGVLFARSGADCVVVTLWQDQEAAEALSTSPTYRSTVEQISETGFLVGASSLQVLELHGGLLAEPIDLGWSA